MGGAAASSDKDIELLREPIHWGRKVLLKFLACYVLVDHENLIEFFYGRTIESELELSAMLFGLIKNLNSPQILRHVATDFTRLNIKPTLF